MIFNNREHILYILADDSNSILHFGVTDDPLDCCIQKLVFYERYDSLADATIRYKNLIHQSKDDTVALIEKDNPRWDDLYDDLA